MAARAGPRLSPTLRNQEALLGLVFIGPQVVGFVALVAGPVLAILYFSVFKWNIIQGTLTFVGSANYQRLLNSEEVTDIARTTVLFGLGFVPATVVGGLAVALAVNSRSRWLIGLRAAYFVPVVISLAAWTLVWRLMLAPDGAVNGLLQWLGSGPVPRLRHFVIALAPLLLVRVFQSP